eukprot:5667097-Amphidinium_carterae.1
MGLMWWVRFFTVGLCVFSSMSMARQIMRQFGFHALVRVTHDGPTSSEEGFDEVGNLTPAQGCA